MAYNILKGTVEFTGDNGSLENTVDLTTDQTVAGGKTFSQRITASAITLGGSSLSHPAITTLNNNASYRVALFDVANPSFALSGNANLSFRYATLTSSFFSGSGIGLRSLQAQEIINKLSASQINFSNGLVASGYDLIVSSSHGISAGTTGVSFNVASAGGLAITSSNGVSVDPTNALDITTSGQSLADADVFIAHDASRGKIVKADALDIYNYVSGKLSSPAITSYTNASNNRVVTSVSSNTVNAEENLTFDGTTLSLAGTGSITGVLELSSSSDALLRLNKANASTKEIEFVNSDVRQAAITLSANEQLIIENETTKDIILKTNNQNTLRVFGQNQRVGIAKEGTVANAELDVDGDAIISGSLSVTGSNLDRLISLKSDSEDPAFFVSGSGDAALSGRLALNCDGTTDPATVLNHAHIYSKLDSGTAEMFVRDSDGNVTKISPHTSEGEWEYYSRNTNTGKVVRVNMERMIRKLEQITGESFMEEWYEDPAD